MKSLVEFITETCNSPIVLNEASKELFPTINHTLKDFFENPSKGSNKEINTIEVPYKNSLSGKDNVIYHFYDDLHTLLKDMLKIYLSQKSFIHSDKHTFCIAFSDCSMKISTCGNNFKSPKNPRQHTHETDHVRFFVITYNEQKYLTRNIDDYGKFEWREEFIIPEGDATEEKLFKIISDKVNSSKIQTNSVTDAYNIEFTGKRTLKGKWTSKVVKKECNSDINVKAKPKSGGNWSIEISGEYKGSYAEINLNFEVTTLNNIGKVIDWIIKPERYKKYVKLGEDGEISVNYFKQDKKIPKDIKDIFVK